MNFINPNLSPDHQICFNDGAYYPGQQVNGVFIGACVNPCSIRVIGTEAAYRHVKQPLVDATILQGGQITVFESTLVQLLHEVAPSVHPFTFALPSWVPPSISLRDVQRGLTPCTAHTRYCVEVEDMVTKQIIACRDIAVLPAPISGFSTNVALRTVKKVKTLIFTRGELQIVAEVADNATLVRGGTLDALVTVTNLGAKTIAGVAATFTRETSVYTAHVWNRDSSLLSLTPVAGDLQPGQTVTTRVTLSADRTEPQECTSMGKVTHNTYRLRVANQDDVCALTLNRGLDIPIYLSPRAEAHRMGDLAHFASLQQTTAARLGAVITQPLVHLAVSSTPFEAAYKKLLSDYPFLRVLYTQVVSSDAVPALNALERSMQGTPSAPPAENPHISPVNEGGLVASAPAAPTAHVAGVVEGEAVASSTSDVDDATGDVANTEAHQ